MLFIIGILLFTITFVVNLTADLVVRGIREEVSESPMFTETALVRKQAPAAS